ncbi:hypothetical protein Curi_c16430 [Gottschalkia acidurici 9a]|uniref:Uncharacterized protein n=1 Tax=Gottschalkia acidurici (strain ATCC 7906 / DSM 604 / BCRC 14475 / CIP 104303 / KCTC 5404 / NCIMB 10678 / 9a) TaxID=1128398 RepID=K0B131_GOTA9|nr:DUF6258 family protein [Gottschalkia acidurici]AFS78650.1 hypothetical protein Curi_c16430 [Gottschalkia acidurici 9a]
MNLEEFLETIYVGDRFIKSIIIDSQQKEVKIQFNLISRIRSSSGAWDFYNNENIENGLIVFTDIETFSFDPPEIIPNDELYDWRITKMDESGYEIDLYMGSYNNYGDHQEVKLKLKTKGIYLEDPLNQGTKIYN